MRNKIYRLTLICIVSLITMSSCSDYLDKQPDDQLTLDMVFNNKTNTEKWLAGIYYAIPDPYSYGDVDPQGDDMCPSPRWEQFGFKVIAYQVGNFSPSSIWTKNYWNTLPQKIRSAYIFLDNVKPLPDQGLSEKEAEYMKAEAKFLIAYYHSLLLTYYGAVPIIRDDQDVSSDNLMVKQEPFYDVVDWINNELLEAAKVLPPNYAEPKKYGRATSVMCLAIRAKLLLFAASPLVNGNTDFADVKNCDGTPIFSSTPDHERWNDAAKACKELIDLAEANDYGLYYEYLSDGSIDPFMSYQNAIMNRYDEGNREILFARPKAAYDGYDYVTQPRGTGGSGAVGVTQSLVDAFFMKNGKAPILGYSDANNTPIINPESSYTESGFSTTDEVRKTRWKEVKGNSLAEQNKVTLAGTYNMYCNREPRFYVSVMYNGSWYNRSSRLTNFYYGGADGGPTHDAPQNGYLVRKKVDPNADPVNKVYKLRSGILYRLAEAYLSYAEALNEYDYTSNVTTIVKYLNLIRERAGIPQYGGSGLEIPENQEKMRDMIHQERRVELNCENGIRFDDIRRWKEGFRIDGKFWGMNFNGTLKSDNAADPLAYFVRTTYQTRKFKSYWMPIPQDDMDKNPNLRQLPGW